MDDEKNIITVSGDVDETVYAKGDTCLLINPFDTYHLFRVYDNWKSASRTPINLADSGQRLYLVFRNRKTEVRIPEYTNSVSGFDVDKANGEVLFKISKENAATILSMSSNVFYITRTFEHDGDDGDTVFSSGEEVVFTGNWADENKWTGTTLTSTIESLRKQLDSANSQILALTQSMNDYRVKAESLSAENATLRSRADALEAENADLKSEVSKYADADEFTSVVISDNAKYQYYKGDTEVSVSGGSLKKELEDNNIIDFSGLEVTPMTELQWSEKLKNSILNITGGK